MIDKSFFENKNVLINESSDVIVKEVNDVNTRIVLYIK